MIVRTEVTGDEGAIRQVNRLAFGGEDEVRLVDAIRQSAAFVPELSLVAEEDTTIVGHALFSGIAIRNSTGSIPALTLAPLAVLPAWQRQGIGVALMQEGLSRARDLGHSLVVVIGHPAYYPRFGFRPARALGLECPFPVPDEAFMVLELQAGVLEAAQGTVVFPAAFDEGADAARSDPRDGAV